MPESPKVRQKSSTRRGRVLIPGLIEAHLHPDKTLIADHIPNRSGTFPEALAITMKLKPTFTLEDVRERADNTIRMLMRHGVTHLWAQAEFDPVGGLNGFLGVMEMKGAVFAIAPKHGLPIDFHADQKE